LRRLLISGIKGGGLALETTTPITTEVKTKEVLERKIVGTVRNTTRTVRDSTGVGAGRKGPREGLMIESIRIVAKVAETQTEGTHVATKKVKIGTKRSLGKKVAHHHQDLDQVQAEAAAHHPSRLETGKCVSPTSVITAN
jgi:hypothetical protein